MPKTSKGYDTSVYEKANSPFAKRLQELITNPIALKEHLGCSIQAINQFKNGSAYPKTENLIKIADFYGVSVDYLLGRTDIPNMDTNMQAVHGLTGLSVEAISKLAKLKEENNSVFLDIISLLIADNNAEFFLALLCSSISTYCEESDKISHFESEGISADITKRSFINTVLHTKFVENLPSLAEEYKSKHSELPEKRMNEHKGGNNNG